MTIIQLNKYGQTLTDRPDGAKAAAEILSSTKPPVAFDFQGVIALGSSFGDEIFKSISERQGGLVEVFHANEGVRFCIKRIVENTGIKVIINDE